MKSPLGINLEGFIMWRRGWYKYSNPQLIQ
nr:MAG TPA: hypothetical protein [Caudoviricetes sp.]